METKSLLDYLTDLPTRVTLYNFLSEKINTAKVNNSTFALFLIDLDGFKKINDTFGHEAGDKIIKDFANILGSYTKDKIDFLARFGGDEFVFITDEPEFYALAEKLRLAVKNNPFVYYDNEKKKNYQFKLSVSIGIVVFPLDGMDTRTLLKNVDKALYYSKFHGKNRITIYRNVMASRVSRFFKIFFKSLLIFLIISVVSWFIFSAFLLSKMKTEISKRLSGYDVIYLLDGDKIEGKILMSSEKEVVIEPRVRGDKDFLTIERNNIQSIQWRNKESNWRP